MFGFLSGIFSKTRVIKIIIIVMLLSALGFLYWRHQDTLRELGGQAQTIMQQLQTIEDISERLEQIEEQRKVEIELLEGYIRESRELVERSRGSPRYEYD